MGTTYIADKLIYFAERKGYFYNWQPMQYYLGENSYIMVNFLHRWKFNDDFKKKSSVFFYYTLRDSDTLMKIANEAYGSPYHFWIPMLFNDMDNPFFSFPLNETHFKSFMYKKYKTEENIYAVHHYETVQDDLTYTPGGIITNKNDEELSSGKIVAITNYQYEKRKNDEKRKIKLIDDRYVNNILTERDKIIAAKFQNTVYKKQNYIFV